MDSPPNQSVVISGAGPVGLFCALKLSLAGITSIIFDPILANPIPWNNNRTIAISYGSMQLLLHSNINLENIYLQKIQHVNISNNNYFGKCDIFAKDYNVDALGYVISYKDLCNALYQACKFRENIYFVARKIQTYTYNTQTNQVDYIIQNEQDNKLYNTSILIVSEGDKKNNTDKSILPNKKFIYANNNQYAHVGWLKTSMLPKQYSTYTAFERFTNQGPIAILPYKYSNNNIEYNYAIVWCNYSDDKLFCNIDKLKQYLSYRIGNIEKLYIEQIFNLQQIKRKTIIDNTIIYIGNAAQSLHPVAGQGLNLGFRQAYSLAQYLALATYNPIEKIAQFSQFMQTDRKTMLATTATMANIFTLSPFLLPFLNSSLGLTLNFIDTTPKLKEKFAQHFMFGKR